MIGNEAEASNELHVALQEGESDRDEQAKQKEERYIDDAHPDGNYAHIDAKEHAEKEIQHAESRLRSGSMQFEDEKPAQVLAQDSRVDLFNRIYFS